MKKALVLTMPILFVGASFFFLPSAPKSNEVKTQQAVISYPKNALGESESLGCNPLVVYTNKKGAVGVGSKIWSNSSLTVPVPDGIIAFEEAGYSRHYYVVGGVLQPDIITAVPC